MTTLSPPFATRRHDHVEKIVRVQKAALSQRLDKASEDIKNGKESLLTQTFLHQNLNYDALTGRLTWKHQRRRGIKAGSIAGAKREDGYTGIYFFGRTYLSHRLIWLYQTGEWPAGQIDHWNLNRADNRWTNLREASNSQNQANTRERINNTSGVKGVTWSKQISRWVAQITVNRQLIYLGCRKTREECAALYAAAAAFYFGDFARAA